MPFVINKPFPYSRKAFEYLKFIIFPLFLLICKHIQIESFINEAAFNADAIIEVSYFNDKLLIISLKVLPNE